jgi:catechol-2,3-dioxygenase
MQLNHLNLCVDDLTEACTFFQSCFDFQFVEQKGEALIVMSDGHGFTLVLSNPQAFGKQMQPYPEGFHIGFLQETRDQVDEVYRHLTATHVAVAHAPRKIRGSYGFYFTALNALLFEVSSPL